ncbi:MAB_1171c family putative transporter [Nocardia sp. NPDC051463]|uniref:MAB_1171c family putative transporter n=1 Tax=Nocardia sp. NPDC051463 TaxID=3154845 RepID=UPI0034288A59
MTTPAPALLTVPTLAFVCAVVFGRWLLVNDTAANRLLNRVLSWTVVSAVIEELGAGTAFAEPTYRIFLGCGVMVAANLYGLVRLFNGADPGTVGQRQRIYNLLAMPAAAVVVSIGRPGDPAEPGFGSVVVWLVVNAPAMLSAAHVIRACVREIRAGDSTRRARAAFVALLVAATFSFYSAFVSGLDVLRGEPITSPGPYWTVPSCVTLVMVTVLTTIPLVGALLARGGLDRTGRDLRTLQPLWRDLTSAVPEVVLTPAAESRRDPESRLYRMVVEIRDALTHLQHYVALDARSEQRIDDYALQIARATYEKTQRAIPIPAVPVRHRTPQVDRDLTAELDHLLELARSWPRARGSGAAVATSYRPVGSSADYCRRR